MRKLDFFIDSILFIYFATTTGEAGNKTVTHEGPEREVHHLHSEIHAAKWEFEEFSVHITILLFLLVVILIKIAFHRIPYVAEYMPESLLLIIFGIVFGAIVRYAIIRGAVENTVWQLTPELFFTYLLPPVVLESSYSLYNRTFSEYLGVVLVFAVIGTVFNFLIIGFSMYGLNKIGAFGPPEIAIDLNGFLLFSSLIVAVDPVAVLAIFQDIGVELSLYYIVFGESLLNDAITVVLYEIMSAFTGQEEITGQQIGVGIASFFTVSLGGLSIGVIVGVISCLLTRIENHLSAVILILLAYFSYIITDVVGWSGIIAMIGCGIVQAAYAFHNLDRKSVTLVRKLTKLVAELSESVIFLFLGVEVVSDQLMWHWGFMLWGLLLCLFSRTVVVFGLTAIVNWVRVDNTRISFTKQLILIYGGLRGAVAFSLAVLVNADKLGEHGVYNRQLIITATLFIILFTVGFMGLTMKPLVKLLKIRLQGEQKLSLCQVLHSNVMDELLAGIEVVIGSKGRNALRDFFMRLDEKYIRRFLQRDPATYDHKLLKTNEKIALKIHIASMQPDRVDRILGNVPETLKNRYLTSAYSGLSFSGMLPGNWSEQSLQNAQYRPSRPYVKSATTRRRTTSGASNPTRDETVEFSQCMRSSRNVSIARYENRQLDFDETLKDVIRSRDRAIRQSYVTTPGLNMGTYNQAYIPEEEEISDLRESEGDEMNDQQPRDLESRISSVAHIPHVVVAYTNEKNSDHDRTDPGAK
ncbi:unnamed protein product [Calicophoron daubneyi]|uniref:Sodium/hydrogen exchanger n=1 Tax=Calicophoron daubneyi TaxID=300641 RepID=A0AAV2U0K5_CALDB